MAFKGRISMMKVWGYMAFFSLTLTHQLVLGAERTAIDKALNESLADQVQTHSGMNVKDEDHREVRSAEPDRTKRIIVDPDID
jgi:hypothetical protein